MQESDLVLAIDGGGSKTEAALFDRAGRTLGHGRVGPCNLSSDPDAAVAALYDAGRQCCAAAGLDPARTTPATTLSAAIAGVSFAPGRQRFYAATRAFARALLSSDAYAGVLGAFDGGPGILLSIGTGTVACRLGEDGVTRRGGWGFPAGDRGGGAWIGLQLVSAWLDHLDGVGPGHPGDAPLWAALRSRLGTSREGVVTWLRQAGPANFAAIAPLLLDTAAPQAISVLDAATDHLAALVRALQPRPDFPVAVAGGLAPRLAPRLQAALGRGLQQQAASALHGAWLIGVGRAAAEFAVPETV